MNKTKKRNLIGAIVAVCLVCTLAVGLVSAYFTDSETKTNVFTIGNIDVELEEPNWVEPTDVLPEQEIAKDPQVKNVGNNDAYVFMEVDVPYAFIQTANDDGSKNSAQDVELFTFDVNDEWVLVGEAAKNAENKTVTYLYAYGNDNEMKALEKGNTTQALFDYVKFANVVSGQNLESATQHVIVKAYAIQTTNVNDGKSALDGANNDGKITPVEVWSVVSK